MRGAWALVMVAIFSVFAFTALGSPPALTESNARLTGTVFTDTNGDGVQDAGEAGVSDITVLYLDRIVSKIGLTTTDSSGTYTFDIPAGDYLVQLWGVAGEDILTGPTYMPVPAGITAVQDFTLRPDPNRTSPPEPQPGIAQILEMINDLKKMISGLIPPKAT